MTTDKNTDKRYAVLIDADNISSKYVKALFDEISNHGTSTYRRIYGDWTSTRSDSWKKVLLEYSVIPIQQYGYTTGKNATDSAMIIDAMDILYSGNVEGFCLVTSDSDFTRLASRLRESGMDVIGMGEQKTPRPFIDSCNIFKYLDLIDPEMSTAEKPADTRKITKSIGKIVEDNSDEDGWLEFGNLGNLINKRVPDFDVRNFGFSKLTPFIKSLKVFELKDEQLDGSGNKITYVRKKQPRARK